MARIVVTHGINSTFDSRPQLAQAWGPALAGGVELAAGRRDVLRPGDIDFVFYGDVFRPAGRFLGDGIPPLTARDVTDPLEHELLMRWWRAAAASDPAVVSPTARTLGPTATARAAVLALAGSRFLVTTTERALVWWLKQMTAYLTDPEVRRAVQARFTSAIDADTRVVVAHSFGTVVAYEGLCADPGLPVTDLVTLGSPLGVPHVILDRLVPAPQRHNGTVVGAWPGGVRRWTNISDNHDFLTIQPRLRSIFGAAVTDIAITNGVNAHRVERYLSAAETGSAILAGLRCLS